MFSQLVKSFCTISGSIWFPHFCKGKNSQLVNTTFVQRYLTVQFEELSFQIKNIDRVNARFILTVMKSDVSQKSSQQTSQSVDEWKEIRCEIIKLTEIHISQISKERVGMVMLKHDYTEILYNFAICDLVIRESEAQVICTSIQLIDDTASCTMYGTFIYFDVELTYHKEER